MDNSTVTQDKIESQNSEVNNLTVQEVMTIPIKAPNKKEQGSVWIEVNQ